MRCLSALKSATGAAALAVAAIAATALAAPSYTELECTGTAKLVEHSFLGNREQGAAMPLRFTARLWNTRNAVTIMPPGFAVLPAGEYAFPAGLEPLSVPFTDSQGVARTLRFAITDTEFKGYAVLREVQPNSLICQFGQELCAALRIKAQMEMKGTCRPK
tara:strand:- start:63 stop:545 length:483 start_codon:yes stop_codon:yes gene_type:complete